MLEDTNPLPCHLGGFFIPLLRPGGAGRQFGGAAVHEGVTSRGAPSIARVPAEARGRPRCRGASPRDV